MFRYNVFYVAPDLEESSDQPPEPVVHPQKKLGNVSLNGGRGPVTASVKTVRKSEKDFNIKLIFETDNSGHNTSKLWCSYFSFCS